MLSWISIIFTVLRYLPTAISILRETWKIIDHLKGSEKAEAKAEFKMALQETKKTKDVKHIEECMKKIKAKRL